MLFLITSAYGQAHAQTSGSTSSGCTAANAGDYDFTPSFQIPSTSFSGMFNSGETLTFTIDDYLAVTITDNTAPATIFNEDALQTQPATSVDYSIPADGARSFSLEVDQELLPSISVRCTEAPKGTITIVKSIDEGDSLFRYIGDLGPFFISTNNQTGSTSFANLNAGIFVVTELPNPDFDLLDINCSGDLDDGSSVNLADGEVSIDLDPGENISCIFISEDNLDEDKVTEDSRRATKGFAYRRARSMLSAEPDRVSFVRRNPDVLWDSAENGEARSNPVRYAFNAANGNARFDFAAATGRTETSNGTGGIEVWIEGSYTKADDDISAVQIDNEYGVVHVGADIQVTKNIIVGGLVSIDKTTEDVDVSSGSSTVLAQEVEGTGWMAGPYLSARLGENLFFNTRIAYGASRNDLTLPGVVTDDKFETDRVLARASMTGNRVFGNDDKWRVTPTASVAYFKEDINRYTSKTGVAISSQSLTIGRAEFEPEIAYRHETADGTVIEPQVALAAVWDFDSPDSLAVQGINIPTDDFRGRIKGGLQVNWRRGNSMRIAASYDGIGAENFDAYGLDAWLDIPLYKPQHKATSPRFVAPPVQYKACPDGTRIPVEEACPVTLVETPRVVPEPIELTVYFNFDKHNLLRSEIAKIDDAVARTAGRSVSIVILEGNTDRAGSDTYNDALSIRRAIAVRDALIARGIPVEVIRYEAFGENNPAVATADGVPLRANRRTEVRIRFN